MHAHGCAIQERVAHARRTPLSSRLFSSCTLLVCSRFRHVLVAARRLPSLSRVPASRVSTPYLSVAASATSYFTAKAIRRIGLLNIWHTLSSFWSSCKEKCHSGPCPPCSRTVVQACRCLSSTATVLCRELSSGSVPELACNRICGAKMSCRRHKCQVVCLYSVSV
jgi:hypothetical protein